MRMLTLILVTALLAACSKSNNPNVVKAGSDMKAAGAATSDAAKNMASASGAVAQSAADQAKVAAAKAADQAGAALQTAGAKIKHGADSTSSKDASGD